MIHSRTFAFFAALLLLFTFAAPDAFAKKHTRHGHGKASRSAGATDARYADIIMNPVTGEIYHEKDPDGKRYPASLTKMMTLYLLFDALEKHRTTLDARLDISEYAASMPQTNLALTPGDSISVETAIKALVVRSANDVAVVVAEGLSGDVEHFADLMTAKAHQLGMKNTVFKNPNGLPNLEQHTTARDMAKLGIALKRDFPKYYKYFATLQFSHNGVTYYTHNRVMLRYAGVDGIKTGFIGASGFNLVTSVVRGGRPLVGVVMGGSTGTWRDNRMIELLNDSYQIVASRGAARGRSFPNNLPQSKNGIGKAGLDAASISPDDAPALANAESLPDSAENEDGGETEPLPAATVPSDRAAVRQPTPFDAAATASVGEAEKSPAPVATAKPVTAPEKAPVVITPRASMVHSKVIQLAAPETPSTAAPTPAKVPFAAAAATVSPAKAPETAVVTAKAVVEPAAGPSAPAENAWGIQVGAFSTQALAVQAARNAMQTAGQPLAAAKMAAADPAGGTVPVHRARLENLTQLDARKACEVLISHNSPCFIYKASQ